MTRPAPTLPGQSENTGPKPVTIDDLLLTIGQLHAQLLVFQRENAHLKERLVSLSAPVEGGGEA